VHAQRLFFQHTGEGDVRELFDGYFDTTSGAKGDPASYRTIAHAIGLDPQRILFLSDTRAELDAARAAGWHALGVARTADLGFAPHPQVTSFADIRLDAFAALDDELVALARACHQRGWVFATSGNFSARVAPGRIAITASGRDKGTLTTVDIVHVDAEGRPIDGRGTPSAETPLHCALYRKLAHIGAVAHTHSVAATVLSRRHREAGAMRLRGYEMAKALTGVHSHETEVTLPIVDNAQDMEVLGARVDRALAAFPTAPAYLVAGHGLTTWAVDVAGARRHLEALEVMLACALAEAG
jgi:methylthioribulose-1-phosphate dehydratase